MCYKQQTSEIYCCYLSWTRESGLYGQSPCILLFYLTRVWGRATNFEWQYIILYWEDPAAHVVCCSAQTPHHSSFNPYDPTAKPRRGTDTLDPDLLEFCTFLLLWLYTCGTLVVLKNAFDHKFILTRKVFYCCSI